MDYFERYETRPGLTLNRIKEILWETIKTFGEERLPLWTRNRYGLIRDRVFVIGDNNNMEIQCIKGSGTELDTHVRIAGPSYDTVFGMGVCIYVNCSGIPFIKITEKYIIYRPDRLGRMIDNKYYNPGSWLVGDTLKDFVSLIITTFEKEYKATYTYRFRTDNVFDDVDIFSTVSKVLETFFNDKIDNLRLGNDIDIRNDPTRKLWYMFARNKETHDIVSHIEFSQWGNSRFNFSDIKNMSKEEFSKLSTENKELVLQILSEYKDTGESKTLNELWKVDEIPDELYSITKNNIFIDAPQPIITIDENGVHCNLEDVTTQRTLTKSEMLEFAEKIRDELDVAAAVNTVKQSLAKEFARKKHASELMKQFGILTRAQIADVVITPSKIYTHTDAFWAGIDTNPVPPETCNFSINTGKIFIDKGDFTMKIKEVTYSEKATIVFWADGTKTVVKAAEGETFSKDVGLAMAIAEKYFGSYSAMKSYIKRNTKDANEANAKKKQKKEKKED